MVAQLMHLLIEVTVGLYLLAFVLRLLLQVVRADFYNPLSQFLVKATDPVLRPARRLIPSMGGVDSASVVIIIVLQLIELILLRTFNVAAESQVGSIVIHAAAELINLFLNVYLFCFFVQVVVSWVNPGAYHPGLMLIHSITEPVLAPLRRKLPPAGGLDFSVMAAMVGIFVLKILVVQVLHGLAFTLR